MRQYSVGTTYEMLCHRCIKMEGGNQLHLEKLSVAKDFLFYFFAWLALQYELWWTLDS